MLRSLITTFSLAALLFVSLAGPMQVSARRCGEKPPETLLALYRNSVSIHIGTYDGSIDVGMIEETESYSVYQIEKKFSFSSTLKGESLKLFNAKESDYRYRGSADDDEAPIEEDYEHDYEYGYRELKEGDAVMVFLRKAEGSEELELADYRDAVKRLSPEEMAAYESRVKELNGLFSEGTPSDQAIVNWLVATAADPLTRWEGVYELLSSFENNEWRAERAKHIAAKLERGEKLEDWELNADFEDSGVHNNSAYAALLTDEQKQALMQMLFDRKDAVEGQQDEAKEPEEAGKIDEGDRVLMQLVRRWGDNRLAEFLLGELRNNTEPPYLKYELMTTIAAILGDAEIRDLAGRYVDIYQDDEQEVEIDEEELADKGERIEPAVSDEAADVAPEEKIEAGDTNGAEVTRKITYGEIRAALLAEFISRSEQKLTTIN